MFGLSEKNEINMSTLQMCLLASLLCGMWSDLCAGDQDAAPSKGMSGFLEQYCFDCHDEDMMEGDLDLTTPNAGQVDPLHFDHWVDIYDRVLADEMPPKKKSRPSKTDRDAFLSSLNRSCSKQVPWTAVSMVVPNFAG